MLKYVLIILGIILVFGVYWVLYYIRFNQVVRKEKHRIYRTTPGVIFIRLLFIGLIASTTTSFIDIFTLEKQVIALEKHVIINTYIEEGFPNDDFEYVYTHYNQYFGGGYSENGEIVICIKEGTPLELIQYLDDNDVVYVFVKHNYSDLQQLRQLIADSSLLFEGTVVISTNEKENKIIISTENVDELSEMFQTYIDEGILEVVRGGSINY